MELELKLNQIVPKGETPKKYNGTRNFEFDSTEINKLIENYEKCFDEFLNVTEEKAKITNVPYKNLPELNLLEQEILSRYKTFSEQNEGFPKYESLVEVLFTRPIDKKCEEQIKPFIISIIEMTKFEENDIVKLIVNGEKYEQYTVNEVREVLFKFIRDKEVNIDLENVKARLFKYLCRKNLTFEKDGQPYNHAIIEVW